MIRFRSCVMTVLLVLLSTPAAWAWNDLGHITVAQIAYRQMSGDERLAVVAILKHHPHFTTYFQKPAGLDVPDDEWLFLRAATWCDFVRPPRNFDRSQLPTDPTYKFHRGPWHYINYPFRSGDALDAPLGTPLRGTGADQSNIVEQLVLTRDLLQRKVAVDPGVAADVTPEQNRAVRLCWLFHLIGDLHQPLHATALVDNQSFPGPDFGDQGGNLIMIRTSARRTSNLHAFWDGQLGSLSGWQDGTKADKLAADIKRCRTQAELLSHGALSAERLVELQQHSKITDWAEESFRVAAAVAYDGGRLAFATKSDVDQGLLPIEQIPLIPPVLHEKARAAANKRIALAGFRLALQLQSIVSPRSD